MLRKSVSLLLALLMLLSVLAVSPITAHAVESGTTGSCMWELDDAGTLTISGNGPMADYYKVSDVPWYEYRYTINKIVIKEGVTFIGNKAFDYNYANTVTIPSTVKRIGDGAFRGTNLHEVEIPDSVTYIGEDCFRSCGSLYAVKLSKNLTELSKQVFCQCKALTEINIPEGVEIIGIGAFNDCPKLKKVTLPSTVKEIRRFAFCECPELREINLEDTKLETVEEDAFRDCPKLTKVNLPETVNTIDSHAFGYTKKADSYTEVSGFTLVGGEAAKNYTQGTGFTYESNGPKNLIEEIYLTADTKNLVLDTSLTEAEFSYKVYEKTDVTTLGCIKSGGDIAYLFCYDEGEGKTKSAENYVEKINPEKRYYIRYVVSPDTGYGWSEKVKSHTSEVNIKDVDCLDIYLNNKRLTDAYFEYNEYHDNVWLLVPYNNYNPDYETEELEDGTLKITKYIGSDSDVKIPAQIGTKKVTVIGYNAFFSKHAAKHVVIPFGVTEIEGQAFYYSGVESVTLPSSLKKVGVDAFCTNSGIETVRVPSSVTEIGEGGFGTRVGGGYSPENMTSCVIEGKKGSKAEEFTNANAHITFKEAADTIVSDDGNLECEIDATGNAKIIKYLGTDTEAVIPEEISGSKVTKIGNLAFSGNSVITSVTIPDSVTEIGEYAFDQCEKLEKVIFGENPSLMRICKYAFSNSGLKSFDVPASVLRIDEGAFFNCGSIGLRQSIPATVQKIDSMAFGYKEDGGNPVKIEGYTVLGENDTAADKYAKDNGFEFMGEYEYKLTDDGEGAVITNYNGTASVVRVPSKLGGKKVLLADANSFAGNSTITEVSFSGACDIGSYSFMNCPNLKSIKITASDMIGEFAFQNCTSLETIGYENRVGTKEIGEYAFFNCPSLKTVNIEIFVKKIGIFAFGYIDPNTKVDGFKLIVRDDDDNEGLRYAKQNGFYVEPTTSATEAAEATTADVTADTTSDTTSDATAETKPTEPAETTAPDFSKPTEPAESTAPDFSKPTDPADTTAAESGTGETKTPQPEETTAPAKTQTFSYIPSKEQQSGTIKVVVLDKGGQYHIYTMSASPMIVDGTPVYTAEIPADITPVSVQYQFYDGDTWKSQITLTSEQFGKVVTSDGKIYGETPATEATTSALTTEPATKAPAVTTEKKDNPIKVKATAKKVSLKKLKKKAQKAVTFKVTGAQGKVSFKIKSVKKAIKKYLSITKKGVLKVKKWKKAKKGTYTVKVSITAKGNDNYNSKSVTKTVKIKIK